MSELKPCPFCGAVEFVKAIDETEYKDLDNFRVVCIAYVGGTDREHRVGCGSTSGYYRTMQEAIEAWNRRAT